MAWLAFGECRGWHESLPTANQALEAAKSALASSSIKEDGERAEPDGYISEADLRKLHFAIIVEGYFDFAQVYQAGGLPALNIVGLPEAAVRESRDRVRAAIQCAQFEFPQRRITCNLAPADLPKEGGRFDLAIALGIQISNMPSAAWRKASEK